MRSLARHGRSRLPAWLSLAFLAAALGEAGCAPNDLGAPCTLTRPVADGMGGVVNEPIPTDSLDPTKDYVATGVPGCDDFTCVKSAGVEQAYCSKRCTGDDVCSGGQSKTLRCRELVLDQAFIEELRNELGEEKFRQVFGNIEFAQFCAEPSPE